MTLASRIVSGSLLTLSGSVGSYACSFIRNMILARVLSKADLGSAATLWMILGLFELTAKMGIGRFVVQDPEGDRPGFVGTMHALQALIGAASSLIILVATPFAVKIFDLPVPYGLSCCWDPSLFSAAFNIWVSEVLKGTFVLVRPPWWRSYPKQSSLFLLILSRCGSRISERFSY